MTIYQSMTNKEWLHLRMITKNDYHRMTYKEWLLKNDCKRMATHEWLP